MGKRLTQIATRTGDDGTTGLGDGRRVPKTDLRVAAMGDVDELNSTLGLLLCEPLPEDVRTLLVVIQHELFNLGGELSMPGYTLLKDEAVLRLDEALATYNATLPALKEFILPAGTRSSSIGHVARTIARRLYASIRGAHDWGRRFDPEPAADVLDAIGGLAPREMRRAWMTAFGNARLASRAQLVVADLPEAHGRRSPIGFMH